MIIWSNTRRHLHWQNRPFWAIAFLRRFCMICLKLDHPVFTSLAFATFFYKAKSSALRPIPKLEAQVSVFIFIFCILLCIMNKGTIQSFPYNTYGNSTWHRKQHNHLQYHELRMPPNSHPHTPKERFVRPNHQKLRRSFTTHNNQHPKHTTLPHFKNWISIFT
jgi:hypothetical protein